MNQTAKPTAKSIIENASRIVIKVGASLIANPDTHAPHQNWINNLIRDVRMLQDMDKEVIIVSAGALILARTDAIKIDDDTPPKAIRYIASKGYGHLMKVWARALQTDPPQILINESQLKPGAPSIGLIDVSLKIGDIPIISENFATIITPRKDGSDSLAAKITEVMEADLLIILSTTNGLRTSQFKSAAQGPAEYLTHVNGMVTPAMRRYNQAIARHLSEGTTISKLKTGEKALKAGAHCIFGDGTQVRPITYLIETPDLTGSHTIFVPAP